MTKEQEIYFGKQMRYLNTRKLLKILWWNWFYKNRIEEINLWLEKGMHINAAFDRVERDLTS